MSNWMMVIHVFEFCLKSIECIQLDKKIVVKNFGCQTNSKSQFNGNDRKCQHSFDFSSFEMDHISSCLIIPIYGPSSLRVVCIATRYFFIWYIFIVRITFGHSKWWYFVSLIFSDQLNTLNNPYAFQLRPWKSHWLKLRWEKTGFSMKFDHFYFEDCVKLDFKYFFISFNFKLNWLQKEEVPILYFSIRKKHKEINGWMFAVMIHF